MRINLALSRSIALLAIAGAAVAFGQTRLYPDTSLFRVPAVTYLDASGAYRRIVYDVAPYKGRMASAFAFLSMPASSGGKVPGIVMVNGMCSPADSMETQRWASMGYAAISVDLTGTRPEVPYACACDVRVSGFDAINVHDEYRYQAAATIVRAVSLLRSLPGVDSTKVGIGGESWGSYNTMTAAGADPRIAFAVMYHGCGFLCDQPFFVQNNGACSDTFRLVVDPGNYIANCYCPTLWFTTTYDFAFGLKIFRESYKAAIHSDYTLQVAEAVHQPNFDRPDPVMERFINSVCKGGTPLPKVTAMGWQPGRVWASYKSFTGMRSAALKYRVNPLPQVQDSLTTWTTIPGTVDTVQKIVSATVPANAVVYYLMLTDNDGMLVTADHVDLTIDPSSGFFRLNTPLSDSTPPPKVTGLQAVVPVSGRVNLQWNAVADPESGINGYNIYRNDLLVTMSNGSSYVDSGLPELTSFTYRVAAVNKAYLEGARSDPAAAAMPADNVPPIVLSATVNGDPQVVRVVFSELVEKASAERAANYAVSGGITVQSATLSSDGKSVVLATSALASTVSYTITVNNVRDRAAAPNTITANARIAITYNPYAPGLSYDYFDAAFSSVDGVAAAVSPRSTGVTPTVSLDPALTNQNFALRFTGYIDIPVSGAYTFYTTSDDGSALYIGSTKVVNNDGAHGMQEAQGVINLTAGKVALTVLYYQGNGGLGLQASWSGPGVAKQLIPASALYHVASSGLTATAFPGNAKGAATANGVRMSILTALTGQPSLRLEMPSAIISPQMVTIGLFDQRGRRIAGVEASYGPGSHTIPLRVGQLARGLYVCRMTIGASERCIPFAVTR